MSREGCVACVAVKSLPGAWEAVPRVPGTASARHCVCRSAVNHGVLGGTCGVPRTGTGRCCRRLDRGGPVELVGMALWSELVLPAPSPARRDPALGLCIRTFSAGLRGGSSSSLGAVHLVPAPTMYRGVYLLLRASPGSASSRCFSCSSGSLCRPGAGVRVPSPMMLQQLHVQMESSVFCLRCPAHASVADCT